MNTTKYVGILFRIVHTIVYCQFGLYNGIFEYITLVLYKVSLFYKVNKSW